MKIKFKDEQKWKQKKTFYEIFIKIILSFYHVLNNNNYNNNQHIIEYHSFFKVFALNKIHINMRLKTIENKGKKDILMKETNEMHAF